MSLQAAILGAGPVGRSLVDRLAERGVEPLVITRSGALVSGARTATIDVNDTSALAVALQGVGVVFHCAQPPYHRWPQEFPALQRSILEACQRVGARLVAVENLYGYRLANPLTESTPMEPTTTKGRVRAELWRHLEDAHQSGRVETAAVRASDFVGPGVAQSAYGARFFQAAARGRKAPVLGDPAALHSVTYVPDLAETMVRVAEDPATFGRAWHAPTAPAISQQAMVDLAGSLAGTRPGIRPIGATMLRLAGLFSPGAREMVEMLHQFTDDLVVDSSRTERSFDLEPTPLAESFAAVLEAER